MCVNFSKAASCHDYTALVTDECMGEMILTERNRSTQRKPSPNATLSTINPTSPGLAKNKGLCGDRPATNLMSEGTAI